MERTVFSWRGVLPQILPGLGAHENEQVEEEPFEEPGPTADQRAGELGRAAAAGWNEGNPLRVAGLISQGYVALQSNV
jgi:hypothetical protein